MTQRKSTSLTCAHTHALVHSYTRLSPKDDSTGCERSIEGVEVLLTTDVYVPPEELYSLSHNVHSSKDSCLGQLYGCAHASLKLPVTLASRLSTVINHYLAQAFSLILFGTYRFTSQGCMCMIAFHFDS